MDLCDLEAVLVYMVSSQAMNTKTWDPVPPKKGKERKKKRKPHGCKRREGAVHFINDAAAVQIRPAAWQSKDTLQSFLSRSLVL